MSPLFKKEDESRSEWFLPEDARTNLTELFARFRQPVIVEAFLKAGVNDAYNEFVNKFLGDLARLSDKVRVSFHGLDGDKARERGVDRSPTLLVAPDRYNIRFSGAPAGEEGRTFMTALVLAAAGTSGLSDLSKEILTKLDGQRHVRVFVTPACPYCPGQGITAIKCAVEKPDRVSAEIVEIDEHPDLAQKYNVGSVPQTQFSEDYAALGLMPEERFVLEMVTLTDASQLAAETAAQARGPAPSEVDLAIVGGGPAGLSAAIYAARAGLSAVILEGGPLGGQVTLTPVVENYPGFAAVPGKKLMEIMAAHARGYVHIVEGAKGESIADKDGRYELLTLKGAFLARALLLATGAVYRKLGVPGEDRYQGFGVSFCSSCDGYLYRGKKAVVVGGGNTALTDALHLKHLGVEVTLVHRREAFRAEKHLQDSVAREGIPARMESRVMEIKGDGKKVTSVTLQGKDGAFTELATDAVFVAVGHEPSNALAKALGLDLDPAGFVAVDRGMRTSRPRIYAAGDLTGGSMQIVTAVSEGSLAALSAFEDLSKPYWKTPLPAQPA
jgi:thioredoxin reductase (NADPH)